MLPTPGPWFLKPLSPYTGSKMLIVDKDGNRIARVFENGKLSSEEVLANGELIASVHELIEALRPFTNITRIPQGSQFTEADINRAEQILSRLGAV